MPAPVVLAIDGNSLVHRSYHAQAHTAGDGTAWAVRGLLSQLVAAVDRVQPEIVVVGFDDPDASLRRERWPQYKAHRVEKLDTLVAQLADAVAAMRSLGVQVVVPPGLEADDVLASTAARVAALGGHTTIVTSDRDSFALIDESTSVLRIINGGVEASPLLTPQRLELMLGIRPAQYRDFAALRGDPSDNLPGVRGIGPRTATALLTRFGTAAAAFDDLDAVREHVGKAVAARLAEPGAREAWQLNCQVMTMHRDVEVGLTDCARLPLTPATVEATYRSNGIVWSLADALRVLAGQEPATPVAPRTVTVWDERPSWSRPRPPALPRRPKVEQLSLFD